MGILDLFKKKEMHDESVAPPDLIDAQMQGFDAGLSRSPDFGERGPELPPMRSDFNQAPASAPSAFNQRQELSQSMSQDQQFQILSAKLDTIKAQLETVIQRLDRIERDEHPYKERWRTGM